MFSVLTHLMLPHTEPGLPVDTDTESCVGTKPGVGHGVGHGLPVVNVPKNQKKEPNGNKKPK